MSNPYSKELYRLNVEDDAIVRVRLRVSKKKHNLRIKTEYQLRTKYKRLYKRQRIHILGDTITV